jgi:hypothetical protein
MTPANTGRTRTSASTSIVGGFTNTGTGPQLQLLPRPLARPLLPRPLLLPVQVELVAVAVQVPSSATTTTGTNLTSLV